MNPIQPISTVELFPPLGAELLAVLKSLTRREWETITACAPWTVKDVTAHLLGGTLGRLADRYKATDDANATPLRYQELVNWINQGNAQWVEAAQRISPSLLIAFLELTDPQLYALFKSWPEQSPAPVSVAWAGESQSLSWFDVAREYTEKWLHQQHIREAVGWPLLTQRRWLFPVLDTFMRALPHAYGSVSAPNGTVLKLTIEGEAGGAWTLQRENGAWILYAGPNLQASTQLYLPQEVAWRLFTKGLSPEQAHPHLRVNGEAELGTAWLNMVAIMA
ncbi:MAG: maleylpyruvate isomerase N-terminal domain-containing protein [Anaerolineales bacterium]|nr:maleylpyruvate isomerase N-terminal domain-containing protein [Anaerolineales bacterium]